MQLVFLFDPLRAPRFPRIRARSATSRLPLCKKESGDPGSNRGPRDDRCFLLGEKHCGRHFSFSERRPLVPSQERRVAVDVSFTVPRSIQTELSPDFRYFSRAPSKNDFPGLYKIQRLLLFPFPAETSLFFHHLLLPLFTYFSGSPKPPRRLGLRAHPPPPLDLLQHLRSRHLGRERERRARPAELAGGPRP